MMPADVLPGESWPDGTGNPTFVQKRRFYAGAIDIGLLFFLRIIIFSGYNESIRSEAEQSAFSGRGLILPAICSVRSLSHCHRAHLGQEPEKPMPSLRGGVSRRGNLPTPREPARLLGLLRPQSFSRDIETSDLRVNSDKIEAHQADFRPTTRPQQTRAKTTIFSSKKQSNNQRIHRNRHVA